MSATSQLLSSTSLWSEGVSEDRLESNQRRTLDTDGSYDVIIIGGGFTGLWTAYHLLADQPTGTRPNVAICEAQFCGYGASGRNGGWCSALYPGDLDSLADEYGNEAAFSLTSQLRQRVDLIGEVARNRDIECGFQKGGTLTVATNPAHVRRIETALNTANKWNSQSNSAALWLTKQQAGEIVNISSNFGAGYDPNCAALHPAQLCVGLARVVEQLGATIFEGCRVTTTDHGVVNERGLHLRSPVVLDCTEAYATGDLKRQRIPIYSLVIATEPLDESQWSGIGLATRPTFTDGRHLLVYGQRSADGRLVFGGRGAPYHFGSRVSDRFDFNPSVFRRLERELHTLFPAAKTATITHRWGGPLAVTRNWNPSVRFDTQSGRGHAGGYAGDGVALSALAGHTLADLVLGRENERTRLPFVNRRHRNWEREPARWLGVNTGRTLASFMDWQELRTKRESKTLCRALSYFH